MTIELKSETVELLEDIKKLPYFSRLDTEFLVNRAIESYHERKCAKAEYARFRRTMLRKRLSHQNWLCAYCLKTIGIQEATLDHIIPIDQGGDIFNPENLVVACKNCNEDKSSLNAEEYISYLEAKSKTL